MSTKTNIQWCDSTWNIARGCQKVDADCKYCYMYRDSMKNTRYKAMEVTKTKTVFNFPLKYAETKSAVHDGKPLIFTSSLTDVFIPEIDSFRDEMWDIIRQCPHLVFLILTKRPERIADHLPADWGKSGYDNVWFGTSIGSQKSVQRALDLIKMKGRCKGLFLSIEPLWAEVNFRWAYFPADRFKRKEMIDGQVKRVVSQHELLLNIDWVIVGGESGNEVGQYQYRPCKLEWINLLVDHCKEAGKPVFVKQMGTYLAKQMGLKDRNGGDINEFPTHL